MPEKPLILVADDEEDVRELVCVNLQQAGFDTAEAANGLEALDVARRRTPAAIVLDVMLPGRDGFRVCEALRSDDATSRIPILMLTARGQTQDRIVGLQKGAVTETPVQTPNGFHVIKLDDTRAAKLPAFDEVKPQIAEALQQKKLQAYQEEMVKKAKEQ